MLIIYVMLSDVIPDVTSWLVSYDSGQFAIKRRRIVGPVVGRSQRRSIGPSVHVVFINCHQRRRRPAAAAAVVWTITPTSGACLRQPGAASAGSGPGRGLVGAGQRRDAAARAPTDLTDRTGNNRSHNGTMPVVSPPTNAVSSFSCVERRRTTHASTGSTSGQIRVDSQSSLLDAYFSK